MNNTFRLKIFLAILFSTLMSLALALGYTLNYWQDDLITTIKKQATDEVQLIAKILPSQNIAQTLAKIQQDNLRLTLLNSQGTVLFDSNVPTDEIIQMDNHADRPEIKATMQNQALVSIRYSNTEQLELVYAATKLPNGDILRIAIPHANLTHKIANASQLVMTIALLSIILAMLLAYFLSKQLQSSLKHMIQVIESISKGHYQRRINIIPGQEFTSLAEAVQRMAESIEQSFQVRRDFIANVSHELRTPLTAIQGYTETILSLNNLSPDCTRFLQIISKHSQYMSKMVEELLTLARLENPTTTLQLQTIDPATQLKEILATYITTFSEKSITLQQNLHLPPQIKANTLHLEQVWRNLLDNAINYAPTNSTIRIQGHTTSDQVVFTVSDQGIGLESHNLNRIFERFFQVSKHRKGPSTGLGLAICKHIIERHQGKIWAISPDGQFATSIIFSLPLQGAKPLDSAVRTFG